MQFFLVFLTFIAVAIGIIAPQIIASAVDEDSPKVWFGLIPPALSAVLMAFFIHTSNEISKLPQEEIVVTESIISAEFNSSVEGTFVLGSGSLKAVDYYYYYKRMDNGAYTLCKLPVDKVYIDFTDDMEPSITYPDKILYHGNAPGLGGKIFSTDGRMYKVYNQKYTLHVPTSSVIKRFNLNVM